MGVWIGGHDTHFLLVAIVSNTEGDNFNFVCETKKKFIFETPINSTEIPIPLFSNGLSKNYAELNYKTKIKNVGEYYFRYKKIPSQEKNTKIPLRRMCHQIDKSHNRHCLTRMIYLYYICTVLRPLHVQTISFSHTHTHRLSLSIFRSLRGRP